MNAAFKSKSHPVRLPDQQEAIRRRAEEIYIRNGGVPGRDLENWAQAEQEILSELAERSTYKQAIVIRIDGVEYVGEYDLESSGGYVPGEFGPASSIPIRFQNDKMFITRPSGEELETTIVKKTEVQKAGNKKTG
jgi:hypothetical protein